MQTITTAIVSTIFIVVVFLWLGSGIHYHKKKYDKDGQVISETKFDI